MCTAVNPRLAVSTVHQKRRVKSVRKRDGSAKGNGFDLCMRQAAGLYPFPVAPHDPQ